MERIEISYKTIIFTVFFLIFLWLLYSVRSIILLLFVVAILTSSLSKPVDKLEAARIPRTLVILIFYILILGGLVGIVYLLIPPVVEQGVAFFASLPQILEETGILTNIKLDTLVPELKSIPGSVLSILLATFSNLLAIFAVLVLTFYSLLEVKNLPKYLHVLFADPKKEEQALVLIDKIGASIGGWVRGEFFLMLIVGTASYIGFSILGLQYAAALAVIAGFLELVPNIGPTIAAVPAILVGLSMSPALGLGALILTIAIQQLENHIIVPQVMKRAVGLNPIITLTALLVGFKLGGAGGALLSIPIFLVIKTVAVEVYHFRRQAMGK